MPKLVALSVGIGTRFPAAVTSLGKVLLAHLPAVQRDAALAEPTRSGITPARTTSRGELLAELGDMPPELEASYQSGVGVDPIGGLEAILSHLLVAELGVPAAHAPLQPFDPVAPPVVDPRAAAPAAMAAE